MHIHFPCFFNLLFSEERAWMHPDALQVASFGQFQRAPVTNIDPK